MNRTSPGVSGNQTLSQYRRAIWAISRSVDRSFGSLSVRRYQVAGTCDSMHVSWNVIAGRLPMTVLSIVGAKWRREVPPSRRLTAREQFLPWAIPSFPAHSRQVNLLDLAVGTPTATVVCSRVVKSGSCRTDPRPVIAAPLVKKLHVTGAAGSPANASRLLPTARNSGERRPDAIESVSGNDHLLLNRRGQPTTLS
jgi:hypothetical protein